MIKNITPGSGITINNNYNTWPSFYNTVSSTGNGLIGQLRYNGTSQNLEVFDGNGWQTLNMSYATVGLNYEAESLLDWAQKERNKQLEREAKMKDNPALRNSPAASV